MNYDKSEKELKAALREARRETKAKTGISAAEVTGLIFASLFLVLPLAAVMAALIISFGAVTISGAAVSLAGIVFALGAPFLGSSGTSIIAYAGMGIAASGVGMLLFVGFCFATKYSALGAKAVLKAIYRRR